MAERLKHSVKVCRMQRLYEWYVKSDEDSDFTLIEGVTENRYAPSKDMDGYIFIVKITLDRL